MAVSRLVAWRLRACVVPRAVHPAARSSPWVRLRETHPTQVLSGRAETLPFSPRASRLPELGVARHPGSCVVREGDGAAAVTVDVLRVELMPPWHLGLHLLSRRGIALLTGHGLTPPSPLSTATSPPCEVPHRCRPLMSWEPLADGLSLSSVSPSW